MSDFILIAFGILTIICLYLYVMYRYKSEKLNLSRSENKELEAKLELATSESQKLKDVIDSISTNRRKADEKIDELHTGDSVANAIGGLCKHKDSDS